MRELLHVAARAFHAPETQFSITGGAIINYLHNPDHWVFMGTMLLIGLQVGLAIHKYYVIWKNRKARGTKN